MWESLIYMYKKSTFWEHHRNSPHCTEICHENLCPVSIQNHLDDHGKPESNVMNALFRMQPTPLLLEFLLKNSFQSLKKKKTIIIAYVSTTESKIPQISCISSAVSKNHLIVVLQNSGSPVLIPSPWPVVGQLRCSLYIILTQGLGVHEPPSSCCTAAKAEKSKCDRWRTDS